MMKSSDEGDGSQLEPYSEDDSDGEKKSVRFSLRILNLPKKTKESYLRESVRNEYKKYGSIKSVEIGEKEDNRIATVFMSERKEVKRAVEATDGRFLFGALIDVYDHSNNEKHEFPFFSSRTLFIGNLEKTSTYEDLKRTFFKYGKILKIELKKVGGANRYAFIQFANLEDARRAVHKMQGERIGKNQVSTCYARSIKTQVLWIHGVEGLSSDKAYYRKVFEQFGSVRSLELDQVKSQLLVAFADISSAHTAYIEFKEKGRKLNNVRMSCDYCSEDLLQSVLYDDIVKKHGLTRDYIQNNWSEIQNKLKRSHDDDEMRSIGSEYEYQKYMELSTRIERDSKSEYRDRYRSRDSRSRERYPRKRSRSRSRGRGSPRHKTKKGKVRATILERVHSPIGRRRNSSSRSSNSSSSRSGSRSRSPERIRKPKKKSKKRRKKYYEDGDEDISSERRHKGSRTSSRGSYWGDKRRSRSPISTSSRSTSRSRSPTPENDSRLSPDSRASPDPTKTLNEKTVEQLEEEKRKLMKDLEAMKGKKITIQNDHCVTGTKIKDQPVQKDKINLSRTINIKIETSIAAKDKLNSDSISGTIISSKKSPRTPAAQLTAKPKPENPKLPVELPVLHPDHLIKKNHLKQDQETSDDHGAESPFDESRNCLNRFETIRESRIETPKKPIPVVLPVLPILPKSINEQLTNKTVREKPRERSSPPNRDHHAIPKEREPKYTEQVVVHPTVSHPIFSSKIDKFKKKVNEDKTEKKKEEKKIKEIAKKEYLKSKPKITQAPNPKKDRLIPRKQEKRFLDDPSRTIEPHEFGDFRKELLQVLQEVKQEVNSREPAVTHDYAPILQDSPIRSDPSLMDYFSFNNTQPPIDNNSFPTERRYPGVGRIKKKPSSEPEKRPSGFMDLVNVQTYLNRILKPEEFSIQSATKRLDIFEEDRKRIMRSPWFPGQDDDCSRPKLAPKSGVYDFFSDWTPDILTDLNQLRDAVDHVLGIVPAHLDTQPNNVEQPIYPAGNLNETKPKDEQTTKTEQTNNQVPKEEPNPYDYKIKMEVDVKPLLNSDFNSTGDNSSNHVDQAKEVRKSESKEEVRKKELQEELKNIKADDYNPNDIFDPTADSDEDSKKKPLESASKKTKKEKKESKKKKEIRREDDLGKKKRKPSSDTDGCKRDKKEQKRKKKASESGESIQEPIRKLSEPSDTTSSPRSVICSPDPVEDRNEMLKERMAKQLLDKEPGKKKRQKTSHRTLEDESDSATTEALRALNEADALILPDVKAQPRTLIPKVEVTENSPSEPQVSEIAQVKLPPQDDLETDDAIAGMEEDFNPGSVVGSALKPDVKIEAKPHIPLHNTASNQSSNSQAPKLEGNTPPKGQIYNPRKRWQQVKTEPTSITPTPVATSVVQPNQNHLPKQPKLENEVSRNDIIMPSTVPANVKNAPQHHLVKENLVVNQPSGIQPAEFSDEERLKIDERPTIEPKPEVPAGSTQNRIGHPKKHRRPSLPSPKVAVQKVATSLAGDSQRRLSVSSEGSSSAGKIGHDSKATNQRPVIINPGHASRKLSSVSDGNDSPSIKLPSRGYKQPSVIHTPPPKVVLPISSHTPTNQKPPMALRTPTHNQQSRMIISPNPNVSPNVIQLVQTGQIPGHMTSTQEGQNRHPTIQRVIHQNPSQTQPQKGQTQPSNPAQQQPLPSGYIIGGQPYRLTTTTGCIVQPSQNQIIQVANPNGGYSQRVLTIAKQPNQSPTAKPGQVVITPGQVVTSEAHNPAKSIPAYSPQQSTIVYRSNTSEQGGRPPTVINSIPSTPHFPIVPPSDRGVIGYPIHPGYPTHQPIQERQEPRSDPSPEQRQMDVMRLIERYHIMWQGMLCLKNDSATVQLHFISGSRQMAESSLPDHPQIQSPSGVSLPQLRIIQRMRLEQPQVETVQNKMFDNQLSCTMIALPCGRDETDVRSQTESLRQKFIEYLSAKHAAGIVNIPRDNGQQYVLHIFPPCQFVTQNLSRLAPDFLQSVQDLPMLMVVITEQ